MILKVALTGNPNVGKSVIFNALTGSRQHVGNWPGKTVERKSGECTYKGVDMEIVDLPGTYSLTARAIDELIARNFIVEEKPDVVVDIIDASNIERNLYLTLLLLELRREIVVALNMMDVAKDKGYKIDIEKLTQMLGVRIVPTVATKGVGLKELKQAIVEAGKDTLDHEYGRSTHRHIQLSYGEQFEEIISKVSGIIQKDPKLTEKYSHRWLAIRLLEQDEDALEKIKGSSQEQTLLEVIQ